MSASAAASVLSMTESPSFAEEICASSSCTRPIASSREARLTSPVLKSDCWRSSADFATVSCEFGPARRSCSLRKRKRSPSRRAICACSDASKSRSSSLTTISPLRTVAPSRNGTSRMRALTSALTSTLISGSSSPGADTVSRSSRLVTGASRTASASSPAPKVGRNAIADGPTTTTPTTRTPRSTAITIKKVRTKGDSKMSATVARSKPTT